MSVTSANYNTWWTRCYRNI